MWRRLLKRMRPPEPTYRFDSGYREEAALADGRRVLLRMVEPADRVLIDEGFQELSARSRYHRFLGVRDRLSDDDLRYLAEFDGVDHFALGAVVPHWKGGERGLGIARFVRLRDQPTVAEPAVAVLDGAQRQGLGTLLAERLVAAARERGVRTFRAQMRADNGAARHLAGRLSARLNAASAGGDAAYRIDGPVLEVEMALPAPRFGARRRAEAAEAPKEDEGSQAPPRTRRAWA